MITWEGKQRGRHWSVGQRKWHDCVRKGLSWILGKVLYPESSCTLEQAPQGHSHSTKPDTVQVLGKYSHTHGVTLGDGSVQGQE